VSAQAGTRRRAIVAGFSPGLSNVLADYLAHRGFDVRAVPTLQDVTGALTQQPADLLVISGRKHIDAVVDVVSELGSPRTTRIVVLLPAEDQVLLRQYREIGIHWVLTMPVTPDRIDAAALSASDPES
jgi:DNA-binding response OmpR family regulator